MSAAAADGISHEELEKAHGTSAIQHAGSAHARETQTSCHASRLARCSETGDLLVFSEWVVKTGAIDRLWDAMCDAVLEHSLLGDCRNVYFIRQVGTELVPCKRLLVVESYRTSITRGGMRPAVAVAMRFGGRKPQRIWRSLVQRVYFVV